MKDAHGKARIITVLGESRRVEGKVKSLHRGRIGEQGEMLMGECLGMGGGFG
jgi:hypothetical protein